MSSQRLGVTESNGVSSWRLDKLLYLNCSNSVLVKLRNASLTDSLLPAIDWTASKLDQYGD